MLLLLALDLNYEAYEVTEFLRDVCEETYNPKPLLDVFNKMAHLLKLMAMYDKAIIASKKLLQMAWFLGDQQFEIKAYEHLAYNYFYKQDVDKARYYSNRVFRGLIESDSSGPKMTSISIRHQRREMQGYQPNRSPVRTMTKVRLANHVETHDQTLKSKVYDKIKAIRLCDTFHWQRNMTKDVVQRMIGNSIIRTATPLERVQACDMPSPSNNLRDQKVLPCVSLLDIQDVFLNIFEKHGSAVEEKKG